MAFVVAAFSTAQRLSMAREVLASAGHASVLFHAARPAVVEAGAGAADVLVLDDGLTDMTLSQTCTAVWSQPATANLPIVSCGAADPAAPVPSVNDARLLRTALTPTGLRAAVTGALTTYAAGPSPGGGCDPIDRVLLVEDDDGIAEPLIDGLARYGVQVDRVTTGMAALTAPPAAMVLLDLGLPDIDGLEVCRQLRLGGDTPVIMLTARGDETDRVVGLELGADDYLAKPFSIRELVARIRAVGRRLPADPTPHHRYASPRHLG